MFDTIGPRMLEAALYVAEHPGLAKRTVAAAPSGRTGGQLGSASVERAIQRGLIAVQRIGGIHYCYPPGPLDSGSGQP